jgi:hypothetical protein
LDFGMAYFSFDFGFVAGRTVASTYGCFENIRGDAFHVFQRHGFDFLLERFVVVNPRP